jgi:phage terminase small subunit
MDALEMGQKHGAMIKSPNGYPVQSPCLSHLNKQTGIMMRIASEFGFTPGQPRSNLFVSRAISLLLEADDHNSRSEWQKFYTRSVLRDC